MGLPTHDPRQLLQGEEAKKEPLLLKGHLLEFMPHFRYTLQASTQSHGPWEIDLFQGGGLLLLWQKGRTDTGGPLAFSATFHRHLSSAGNFVFCLFPLIFWVKILPRH